MIKSSHNNDLHQRFNAIHYATATFFLDVLPHSSTCIYTGSEKRWIHLEALTAEAEGRRLTHNQSVIPSITKCKKWFSETKGTVHRAGTDMLKFRPSSSGQNMFKVPGIIEGFTVFCCTTRPLSDRLESVPRLHFGRTQSQTSVHWRVGKTK